MDREFTITVTEDEARAIEHRVRAGDFASAEEVVKAAVASFTHEGPDEGEDSERLRHLIQESIGDPSPDVPLEKAFAELRRRIGARG